MTPFTAKPFAEVVDEREKTPTVGLDLRERAGADVVARNIPPLQGFYGLADGRCIRFAHYAVFVVEKRFRPPSLGVLTTGRPE